MAKASAETLRVRPNSSEENLVVLRQIQSRKEVLQQDSRRQDELTALFDRLNSQCASRSAKQKRKLALVSSSTSLLPGKSEKSEKTARYGPLPGFPIGKWWGIRMDCSRDCVHEPFNESVHHGPFGAISICTSHLNIHNDVDLGDILTFTSQKYSVDDKSKDSLILSYKNRVPLRLVRSYCLSNDFAPKTGYRYDGLYTVIDHWIGISPDNTKYHKFALVRVLDQENSPWATKVCNSSKISKFRKSSSPRFTRSHEKIKLKESNSPKFVYKEVKKEPNTGSVSAIVSRQVFKKFIPGSPDSSKSVFNTDSTNFCPNSFTTKLCNTNLSIRTNLYDSSHNSQDIKKSTNLTFCRTFKSNQSVQDSKKNLQEEKVNTDTPDTEGTKKIISSNNTLTDECSEKKIKKVTWADSCGLTSSNAEKPSTANTFKFIGTNVIDGFSSACPKKCYILKYNNELECLSAAGNNNSINSSTKSLSHIAQVHSRPNTAPQTARTNFSTMCEPLRETEKLDETSVSIDSLAPDKLVSVIVKSKYHPMAKLLIGHMIGLENQESVILSAYNTLNSKVDQEDPKKSKENKLRNKFYIRNNTRKNGVLKKQRREITNLIIDAKFDTVTRSSRNRQLRTSRMRISKSEMSQRKFVNARRISSRNLNKEIRKSKEIRNGTRELKPKKPEKCKKEETEESPKRTKIVSTGTQCTLLQPPKVDQSVQVGNVSVESVSVETDSIERRRVKVEIVDLDDVKSEPCDSGSNCDGTSYECDNYYANRSCVSGSAFSAVNTVDSSVRIARLRSIGFRPIGNSPIEDEISNQELYRPDVDEEYNKYTSEETSTVGYMDEQLHFEDIEEEEMDVDEEHVESTDENESTREFSPQPLETLTEEDFNKPWHGWKKICINGQVHWTGY